MVITEALIEAFLPGDGSPNDPECEGTAFLRVTAKRLRECADRMIAAVEGRLVLRDGRVQPAEDSRPSAS